MVSVELMVFSQIVQRNTKFAADVCHQKFFTSCADEAFQNKVLSVRQLQKNLDCRANTIVDNLFFHADSLKVSNEV